MPQSKPTTGKKTKVALGLSGGVDSAVAAHLLQEQGYDVTAIYLECWHEPGCRAEKDRKDALKIALQLNLPFEVLDFKKTYRQKVMSYFLKEYQAGRTPNPDIMCNKIIKFGLFYDWAMQQGFDYIATGHYARVECDEWNMECGMWGVECKGCGMKQAIANKSQTLLVTGVDLHKDQTYFLCQITAEQLEHTLFPIGHLNKKQVREMAEQQDLHVAKKKDSVGICFVGDINVRKFLKQELGENPGQVVDKEGHIIGSHQGLWFYTIGQRQGFTIDTKALFNQSKLTQDTAQSTQINPAQVGPPPLYVIGKNQQSNQLVVGTKVQTKTKTFTFTSLHLINPETINWLKAPNLKAKIRHAGKLLPAQVEKLGSDQYSDQYQVKLGQAAEGVAAGQSVVFYLSTHQDTSQNQAQSFYCLGGGIIKL